MTENPAPALVVFTSVGEVVMAVEQKIITLDEARKLLGYEPKTCQ